MQSKSILIVDDEPRIARALRDALEQANQNYDIKIAQSGEEALENLKEIPVDLVVTDLRMPGISGLDVIRWTRASDPPPRTILFTGYGDDAIEAEALRLEASQYLTKPFDISELLDAVQEALQDTTLAPSRFTFLSEESYDAIYQELESLSRDLGARCIFLADMQGRSKVEVGITEDINSVTLLSLLAGSLSVDKELASKLGKGEKAMPNFYQGKKYEVYWLKIGEHFFLTIVCERGNQTSNMGLVQFYTQRTSEALLPILSTTEKPMEEPGEPLFEEGFAESVASQLDDLLGGDGSSTEQEDAFAFEAADMPLQEEQAEDKNSPAPDESEEDLGLLSLEEAVDQGIAGENLSQLLNQKDDEVEG